MDRAYGKAFQALDVTQLIQEQSLQKVIHEVRSLAAPTAGRLNSNPDEPEPPFAKRLISLKLSDDGQSSKNPPKVFSVIV
jgi:hypothetical protein